AFTPPYTQKTLNERKSYWEKAKKLSQGNMVCLLWPNEDIHRGGKSVNVTKYTIYFGTIARRDDKMLSEEKDVAKININFINLSIYSVAMRDISNRNANGKMNRHCFMVESTDLLFESYKNILKTLQESQPESLPFGKYLAPRIDGDVSDVVANVDPPIYSIAPGFRFDLSILIDDKSMELRLDTGDAQSKNEAIECLEKHSKLDKTQCNALFSLMRELPRSWHLLNDLYATIAQALVSALSREIALIEGPPGTGKSYIGVQICASFSSDSLRKSIKLLMLIRKAPSISSLSKRN
ncbi:3998_t:CDS:2, partial [Acaulospora colombiana]